MYQAADVEITYRALDKREYLMIIILISDEGSQHIFLCRINKLSPNTQSLLSRALLKPSWLNVSSRQVHVIVEDNCC